MNESVPEWWQECGSFFCTKYKHFSDTKVKGLAHRQATAFRVPAAQLEKDGLWCTPPCLSVLEWGDYLPPKDFQGIQDYQEVWCEEMVALAMALQRCAICSGLPPGMLCRAVQELCWCLTPVIESGNLIDFEMLDVARRDPMASTSAGSTPLPTPRVSNWSVYLPLMIHSLKAV